MFEDASGTSLVTGTAEDTIAKSTEHFSFTSNCGALVHDTAKRFRYANYAEGGSCGDTPATKADFLGTFKEQVDAFEVDCMASPLPLGNTLFVIWFGANDLYTAECSAEHMAKVAQQVAGIQRARLLSIFKKQNAAVLGPVLAQACVCKFVFVDLARPLTSVRYTKRLQDAEAEVAKLVGPLYQRNYRLGPVKHAAYTLQQASVWGHQPGFNIFGWANDVEKLRAQVEETKRLERGVRLYNACLESIANHNGDCVAHIGICVSEDTIRKLATSNTFRLKEGAMSEKSSTHISAESYNQSASIQHIVTIDEVHPTDQMYKLIWLEIYEQIKRSNCTFGNLVPSDQGQDFGYTPNTPLTALSQQRQGFGAVMQELLATRKPTG
jgi:lysophospholipase L1-like esterase